MKRILLAFIVLFTSYQLRAQLTSCAQTLRLARSIYEQGRLHEIPALLSRCLEGGFTQQEKVEAYKLLCLSYIYLEEPEKADEAMLNLLRTDHYFEINESTDPAEFIALYRTFRTTPVYRLGAKLGANASQPNVVSYVPANDGTSKYLYGIGFQGGVVADIPIKGKLVLHPELDFILKNFKYENQGTYTEAVSGDKRSFTTNGNENQAWVSLPVLLQYEFSEKKKFNPYVSAGFSVDYLMSAKNKFRRIKEQATSLEEKSISIKPERKNLNISAVISAGAKFKVTGGFAIAEVRYMYGLTKVNDKQNIYTLYDRTFPTGGYVDGIFKMTSASVTVGYVYNIFNPKKLKK
jgi:outer membrane protein W